MGSHPLLQTWGAGEGGRPSGAAKPAGPRGSRNLAAGQGGFPRPPGKPGPGPSAALPMTVQDDNAGSTRVPSSAVREQTLDLGPRTPFAWDAYKQDHQAPPQRTPQGEPSAGRGGETQEGEGPVLSHVQVGLAASSSSLFIVRPLVPRVSPRTGPAPCTPHPNQQLWLRAFLQPPNKQKEHQRNICEKALRIPVTPQGITTTAFSKLLRRRETRE